MRAITALPEKKQPSLPSVPSLYKDKGPGWGQRQDARSSADANRSRSPHKGKDGKGKAMRGSIFLKDKEGKPCSDFRTCRFDNQKREVCKFYNDSCTCTNSACPKRHVCDVMLPDGTICGAYNHARFDHKGPVTPL